MPESDEAIHERWKARALKLAPRELEIAAYVLGTLHTIRSLRRSFQRRKGDPPAPASYAFERSEANLDTDWW